MTQGKTDKCIAEEYRKELGDKFYDHALEIISIYRICRIFQSMVFGTEQLAL